MNLGAIGIRVDSYSLFLSKFRVSCLYSLYSSNRPLSILKGREKQIWALSNTFTCNIIHKCLEMWASLTHNMYLKRTPFEWN